MTWFQGEGSEKRFDVGGGHERATAGLWATLRRNGAAAVSDRCSSLEPMWRAFSLFYSCALPMAQRSKKLGKNLLQLKHVKIYYPIQFGAKRYHRVYSLREFVPSAHINWNASDLVLVL